MANSERPIWLKRRSSTYSPLRCASICLVKPFILKFRGSTEIRLRNTTASIAAHHCSPFTKSMVPRTINHTKQKTITSPRNEFLFSINLEALEFNGVASSLRTMSVFIECMVGAKVSMTDVF